MKQINNEQAISMRSILPTRQVAGLSKTSGGGEPETVTAESVESASLPSGGSGTSKPDDRTPSEHDEGESDSPVLPLDQVFEILKNSRRRQTLYYLKDNDGVTLSDLAEHIAAIENDTTVEAISSSQRKRVYVGLYQCHLPKMDDMDIVDFDKNRGTIEQGVNADQLDPYLEQSQEPAWHRLYTGITGVGAGLFVASLVVTGPFGFTPASVLAALLGALAVSSLYHTYVEHTNSTPPMG